VIARPQVQEVLADRALNGVQAAVYYHGEEVATRMRYDARLLLAQLVRLDRLETRHAIAVAARDFDAQVERLAHPPVIYDWDDEEDEEGWGEQGDDAGEGEDRDEREDDGEKGWPEGRGEAAAAEGAAAAPAGEGGTGEGFTRAAGFPFQDSVSCVSNTAGEAPEDWRERLMDGSFATHPDGLS
jgi:hypothetical protein